MSEASVAVEVVVLVVGVGDIVAPKELKHHAPCAPPVVVAVRIAFIANSVPVHPAPGQQNAPDVLALV